MIARASAGRWTHGAGRVEHDLSGKCCQQGMLPSSLPHAWEAAPRGTVMWESLLDCIASWAAARKTSGGARRVGLACEHATLTGTRLRRTGAQGWPFQCAHAPYRVGAQRQRARRLSCPRGGVVQPPRIAAHREGQRASSPSWLLQLPAFCSCCGPAGIGSRDNVPCAPPWPSSPDSPRHACSRVEERASNCLKK